MVQISEYRPRSDVMAAVGRTGLEGPQDNQLGKAVTGLSAAVDDLGQGMDLAHARRMAAERQQALRDAAYGADGKSGFMATAGKAAMDGYAGVAKGLTDGGKAAEAALSGRQRQMYRALTAAGDAAMLEDMRQHQAKQAAAYRREVAAAEVDQNSDTVVAALGRNPTSAMTAWEQAHLGVATLVADLGHPPDGPVAAKAHADLDDRVLSAAVEGRIDGDPDTAAVILRDFGGRMSPQTLARLSSRLTQRILARDALAAARDPAGMLAAMGKEIPPILRDIAPEGMTRDQGQALKDWVARNWTQGDYASRFAAIDPAVDGVLAEQRAARIERQQRAREKAGEALARPGPVNPTAIPPGAWREMHPADRAAVKTEIETRKEKFDRLDDAKVRLAGAMEGVRPFDPADPEDRAQVELLFEAGAEDAGPPASAAWGELAARIARDTGVAPTPMIRAIEAGLSSPDPDAVLAASDHLGRLRDLGDPGVLAGFSPKALETGLRVSDAALLATDRRGAAEAVMEGGRAMGASFTGEGGTGEALAGESRRPGGEGQAWMGSLRGAVLDGADTDPGPSASEDDSLVIEKVGLPRVLKDFIWKGRTVLEAWEEAHEFVGHFEKWGEFSDLFKPLNWPPDTVASFEIEEHERSYSGPFADAAGQPTLKGKVRDSKGQILGEVATYDGGYIFYPPGSELPVPVRAPIPYDTMWGTEEGLRYGREKTYIERVDKMGPAVAKLLTGLLPYGFFSGLVADEVAGRIKTERTELEHWVRSAAFEVRMRQIEMREQYARERRQRGRIRPAVTS